MTNLTPRELEVFKLVASGETSVKIGEKLKLSHKTVDYHWSNLAVKLNLTSRVHAAHLALSQGLIRNIYSEIT